MGFRMSLVCVGLVVLAVSAAPLSAAHPVMVPISPDGIQRIEISADSYAYTPDYLIVKVNVPVELTIRSKTWVVPHSFVLKAPEAGVDIKREIPAGESVVVTLTPTHVGMFTFYCDKRLLFFKSHQDRGMKGTLEVTE